MENPIDKEKITENPGLLQYPHHVGSPAFKPMNKSLARHRSLSSMQEQTEINLHQIYKQMELLAKQANEIKMRVEVSEKIYASEIGFIPVINQIYHLYEREEEMFVLSMIGPDEWTKKLPFRSFVATVRLLADHTWMVMNQSSPILS
jgi:Protein of unknown function (DUF2452)